MTIVDWLKEVNSSYLVALALVVFLIVEAIKASDYTPTHYLPLVAGAVGLFMGLLIGLIYQEKLIQTSFTGFVAGLLSAGSFDFVKATWQLRGTMK